MQPTASLPALWMLSTPLHPELAVSDTACCIAEGRHHLNTHSHFWSFGLSILVSIQVLWGVWRWHPLPGVGPPGAEGRASVQASEG